MPVLHSVPYRTSGCANPHPIGATRTRPDALANIRALLCEIAGERVWGISRSPRREIPPLRPTSPD